MKQMMVLGIGNILMGDDGIGVYLVRDLSRSNQNRDVEFVVGETDVHYCVEMTRMCKRLIIVDAVMTGKEPGEITVFPWKNGDRHEKGISMHNLHFLEEAAHMSCSWEGIIIGVESKTVSFQLGLSSPLQEKYSDILGKVSNIIRGYYIHNQNFLYPFS